MWAGRGRRIKAEVSRGGFHGPQPVAMFGRLVQYSGYKCERRYKGDFAARNLSLWMWTQQCVHISLQYYLHQFFVFPPTFSIDVKGLDMGRRFCVVGYCRSIEMLSDVVEDSVREQGGEVSTSISRNRLFATMRTYTHILIWHTSAYHSLCYFSLGIPFVFMATQVRANPCMLLCMFVHTSALCTVFVPSQFTQRHCTKNSLPMPWKCSQLILTQCSDMNPRVPR